MKEMFVFVFCVLWSIRFFLVVKFIEFIRLIVKKLLIVVFLCRFFLIGGNSF